MMCIPHAILRVRKSQSSITMMSPHLVPTRRTTILGSPSKARHPLRARRYIFTHLNVQTTHISLLRQEVAHLTTISVNVTSIVALYMRRVGKSLSTNRSQHPPFKIRYRLPPNNIHHRCQMDLGGLPECLKVMFVF